MHMIYRECVDPARVHMISRGAEKANKYLGFPSLGLGWQKLENPHLRKSLGMGERDGGVLVRSVEKTSPAAGVIQEGDVMLSFQGVDIGKDGTVPFR